MRDRAELESDELLEQRLEFLPEYCKSTLSYDRLRRRTSHGRFDATNNG